MTETTKSGLALALDDWRVLINDDWRSLAVALYMVLVGYGVLVGIPVISTAWVTKLGFTEVEVCLLYTSPSPRDKRQSRMPSSA